MVQTQFWDASPATGINFSISEISRNHKLTIFKVLLTPGLSTVYGQITAMVPMIPTVIPAVSTQALPTFLRMLVKHLCSTT